jgi:cytochrome P450
VVTRYDDVIQALRDPGLFSSEMEELMALGTVRPMIPQQVDPPKQTKFRRLLDPCFSKKRMAVLEPEIRRHARELAGRLEKEGRCDFNPAFAIPLPCIAFLKLMGLPEEDLSLFLRLKDGILRPHDQIGTIDLEAMKRHRTATGQEIYRYFERVIERRRREPGDDMVSFLLATEIDGERLTDEDILDVSFLLILAGLDTVTATLGCSIAYLAHHPEHRRRLVADPGRIPDAVEELLRWETPVTGVPRVCTRDTAIEGFEIRAGELVTFMLGAANTDESEFKDAHVVDFDRVSNRHVAFGAGPHRCLGSHLARLELRIGLEEWHARIPEYRIPEGEVPRYSPGIREVQYLPLCWEPAG